MTGQNGKSYSGVLSSREGQGKEYQVTRPRPILAEVFRDGGIMSVKSLECKGQILSALYFFMHLTAIATH